jgi:EpsD family peptidyl-prolyl cis-trans isomerase
MRLPFICGLLLGVSVSLSACGKNDEGGKLGKGQVIASVNGEDITVYELSAELQDVSLPSGEARKRIEQAALQKIIDRKILADIARERKLDKTPQYLLQSRRADDLLLAGLLQSDAANKTPEPSSEDVEKFIADHPEMFGQRKLIILDQIQFPIPSDRKELLKYQPLKTLDEIEQKLTENNIDYRRAPTSIDTVQLPAQMTKSILALPPEEVFVVPGNGGLTANRITAVKSVPFIGRDALRAGREMLRKQRIDEKARTDLEPLIKEAKARISYQSGYAPPAAAKPSTPVK